MSKFNQMLSEWDPGEFAKYDRASGKNINGKMPFSKYWRIASACGTADVEYGGGACAVFAKGLHEFLGANPSDTFVVAWRAPAAGLKKDLRRLYHIVLKHEDELFDGSGNAARGLRKAVAIKEFPISAYDELLRATYPFGLKVNTVVNALQIAYNNLEDEFQKKFNFPKD